MIKNRYHVTETMERVYTYEVLAENELEAELLVRDGKVGAALETHEMRPQYKALLKEVYV